MTPETPVFPYETVVNNGAWFIDDLPEGGKILKIAPLALVPTANGPQQVPVGTAFSIVFSDEGWERFQRDIAAGKRSPIVVATPNGNGALN